MTDLKVLIISNKEDWKLSEVYKFIKNLKLKH